MEKINNLFAPAGEQTGKGGALTRSSFGRHARSLLALCLCLCMTLGLLPAQAAEEAVIPNTNWSDDVDTQWYTDHTTEPTYTINTAKELAGLAYLVNTQSQTQGFNGKIIKLGRDIDLSKHLWTPIGNAIGASFTGTLDGAGHTITGMTVKMKAEGSGTVYAGLVGQSANGTFQNLILEGVSISLSLSTDAGGQLYVGGLLGSGLLATVSGCKVSGTVSVTGSGGAGASIYVGGIIGFVSLGKVTDSVVSDMTVTVGVPRTGNLLVGGILGRGNDTIKNCIATDLTFNITGDSGLDHAVSGIANKDSAGLTVENCFFSAPTETIPLVNEDVTVKYSYWLSKAGTSGSNVVDTESYEVKPYQVAGTGNDVIKAGTTYANTTSLTEALNKWATEKGMGEWALYEGAPILKALMPPVFIDIKDMTDQDQESTTGSLDADVTLHGQVQKTVSLLSVTLPATIPFIIDVDGTGTLERVLSATATLANRSDTGVTVELTNVTDNDGLLTKANLFLVPDPAPAQGVTQIPLTVNMQGNALLAALAAPADKATPTTATVKVDGTAIQGQFFGTDGEEFILGLTFKVTKTT